MAKENKNPDFVNVEFANKTLTGFEEDSTNKLFLGEKRYRYTTYIFPFYELYIENKASNKTLFKKALKKRTRRIKMSLAVFNGAKLKDSIVFTEKDLQAIQEKFDENENSTLDIYGFETYTKDVLSIVNIISSNKKIVLYLGGYSKGKGDKAAQMDIIFVGDNGFSVVTNRLIRNK